MSPIERLEAIESIRALKARYFRTLDTKDWAAHEQVFVPDLVADMRDAAPAHDPGAITHGAARYVAALAPILEGVVTVHHGHTPEIEILSADSASARWAMEDKLWVGEGSVLPFRFLHGYGHYHETYTRHAGSWRIATIRLTRLRIDTH
ncbi:MAG: nuclear transport factor 2 family protein [Gammaproteobacteria bacterium]